MTSDDDILVMKTGLSFMEKKISLYDALGLFMRADHPLPDWVVEAVETGFDDFISGKRTLESVFGLTPKPGARLVNAARKSQYSGAVYWAVKYRSSLGQPIDVSMYEDIAKEMEPTFLKEWPNTPPPSGSTLKTWRLEEFSDREPELADRRNKRKSKTA